MTDYENYSPIMHIGMALHFGRWESILLAMLTAYFDASGREEQQHSVVMAGFVNSANNWVEFERDWKKFLADYEVPYFHMKEFASSTGPYKKWEGIEHEPKRRAFINDALRLIERHGCWSFATLVVSEDFNQAAKDQDLENTVGNAYLFTARTCLSDITGWCDEHRMNHPVEYVFEKGDPKQGLLRQIMEHDGLPQPIFRSKTEKDSERSIVPLQASDFLAWEIRRGYKDEVENKPLRYPLKEFDRMSGKAKWGTYARENLASLSEVSNFVRKIEAARDES